MYFCVQFVCVFVFIVVLLFEISICSYIGLGFFIADI